MADEKVLTIPLSKVAAELAEKHEMSKKAVGELLGAFVDLTVKHLKKGQQGAGHGAWHLPGPQAPGAHGPQSRHRRSDQDQGVEEAGLPRRQGSQGRDLKTSAFCFGWPREIAGPFF